VEARRAPGTWLLASLALAVGVAGTRARAADVAIAWDPDLARPADQEAYERQLRAIVQDARSRVEAGLGMPLRQPPTVKVHSRAAFERAFGAGAACLDAARYVDDVVHVNGGARLDDRFAGVVVHELVHAVLDVPGQAALPRWLEEGLAERLSWQRRGQERLAPNQVAELKQASERRALVPLPASDGDLSPFDYLRSYAALLFLEARSGRGKVLSLVQRALGKDPFDGALRAELGLSPEGLDREFAAWVAIQ
jgi:hypothetical protein